jgi:predicted transcriptional regulator
LGVLENEEDRVRCRGSGRWFKALAHHARQTHRLTPEKYRAIFGLNASTARTAQSVPSVALAGPPAPVRTIR